MNITVYDHLIYEHKMSYAMDNASASLLENNENNAYSIPTWEDLRRVYDAKWLEEKEKFHNQLKENFRALVSQYKSGQQEIFELSEGTYTKHYEFDMNIGIGIVISVSESLSLSKILSSHVATDTAILTTNNVAITRSSCSPIFALNELPEATKFLSSVIKFFDFIVRLPPLAFV